MLARRPLREGRENRRASGRVNNDEKRRKGAYKKGGFEHMSPIDD